MKRFRYNATAAIADRDIFFGRKAYLEPTEEDVPAD